IDDYAYYAMDRTGWQKLIDSMKEKGAVISDDDRSILLDWLVSKFGPDSKPFPRTRAEGPILNFGGGDTAARDTAAKRVVESVCRPCHPLERIEVAKYSGDKWRDIVTEMRTKGAQIDAADVAPLGQYLAKTYGANCTRCCSERRLMESIISTLVNRFDRGTLTRRELIQGLAMLAAGDAARAAAAQDAAMKTVKIDLISIQVGGLPRSIRFYQTLFGLH